MNTLLFLFAFCFSHIAPLWVLLASWYLDKTCSIFCKTCFTSSTLFACSLVFYLQIDCKTPNLLSCKTNIPFFILCSNTPLYIPLQMNPNFRLDSWTLHYFQLWRLSRVMHLLLLNKKHKAIPIQLDYIMQVSLWVQRDSYLAMGRPYPFMYACIISFIQFIYLTITGEHVLYPGTVETVGERDWDNKCMTTRQSEIAAGATSSRIQPSTFEAFGTVTAWWQQAGERHHGAAPPYQGDLIKSVFHNLV